jgi:hypothetical protein
MLAAHRPVAEARPLVIRDNTEIEKERRSDDTERAESVLVARG